MGAALRVALSSRRMDKAHRGAAKDRRGALGSLKVMRGWTLGMERLCQWEGGIRAKAILQSQIGGACSGFVGRSDSYSYK